MAKRKKPAKKATLKKPGKKATRKKASRKAIPKNEKRIAQAEKDMAKTFAEIVTIATSRGWDTSSMRIRRNADNSVDGEIRVFIPRGTHEKSVFKAMQKIWLGPRIWFSIGARYVPKSTPITKREKYIIIDGLADVVGRYSRKRYMTERIADALKTSETMRERYKRKPLEIFIRLHFNLGDRRPRVYGKK